MAHVDIDMPALLSTGLLHRRWMTGAGSGSFEEDKCQYRRGVLNASLQIRFKLSVPQTYIPLGEMKAGLNTVLRDP